MIEVIRELSASPSGDERFELDPDDHRLAEERRWWQAMFDQAPTGMALIGRSGQWLAVNQALCRMLDRSADELLSTRADVLTHPDDGNVGLADLGRALDGEIDQFECEKRFLRRCGEVVWTRLSVTVVRDDDGERTHLLAHLQDITAHKEAEAQLNDYAEQLQDLASRDPLTGLHNYRTFHRRLGLELSAARRDEHECSVVLFDLDNFRGINRRDRLRGDELLERVAGVVLRSCRSTDIAARIGPDEFALILPGTPASTAQAVGRRIADEVQRDGLASLSYGVGASPNDGDPDLVLLRADAEVQSAKLRLHHSGHAVSCGTVDGDGLELDTIRQFVSLARRALSADVAYLARIDGAAHTVCAVDGDAASFGLVEGGVAPRDDGLGTGSQVCVPVTLTDGREFGTLCIVSQTASATLDESRDEILRSVAEIIVEKLDHDLRDAAARRQTEEMAGMNALVSALIARDRYTGEHSRTVVRLAVAVARRMGLDEDGVRQVEQIALLHDIGKVGVPDAILQKRGPLTDREWELMREHPAIGARILAGTRTLAHLAPAVHAEHERFDGTGYPNGLVGSAIPVVSRITFACDAYDAMTTDRPYRAALQGGQAEQELRAGAGTQFDPDVVDALLEVLDQERAVMATAPDPASTREPGA